MTRISATSLGAIAGAIIIGAGIYAFYPHFAKNPPPAPVPTAGQPSNQPVPPPVVAAQSPPPGSVAVEITGGKEATVDNVTARNAEKGVVIKDVDKSKTSNVTHDPLANQAPQERMQPSTSSSSPPNEKANASVTNVEIGGGFQTGVKIKNAPTTHIENLSVDTKPSQLGKPTD